MLTMNNCNKDEAERWVLLILVLSEATIKSSLIHTLPQTDRLLVGMIKPLMDIGKRNHGLHKSVQPMVIQRHLLCLYHRFDCRTALESGLKCIFPVSRNPTQEYNRHIWMWNICVESPLASAQIKMQHSSADWWFVYVRASVCVELIALCVKQRGKPWLTLAFWPISSTRTVTFSLSHSHSHTHTHTRSYAYNNDCLCQPDLNCTQQKWQVEEEKES